MIHGRNKLTWSQRIKYDIWHVEYWNFLIDIKILFKTIWVVASDEGLYTNIETNEIAKVD